MIMNDFDIIQAKLLLFGHNLQYSPDRDRYHYHSCWQMEYIHKGSMQVYLERQEIIVNSGEVLIIPPRIKHAFEYNGKPFGTWSLKYKLVGLSANQQIKRLTQEPLLHEAGRFIETALRNSQSPLPLEKAQAPPENFPQRILLESMIASLTAYAYQKNPTSDSSLATKVRSMIRERNGGALTVAEAAKKLGYSKNHLSFLFKEKCSVPLKTFIDRERVEIAKKLLAYTEMNISETAEAMGFKDVYYFSNFFKRLTGQSPLHYLKEEENNS